MSSKDASNVYQTDQLSDITLNQLQLNLQPFAPVSSTGETFADEMSAEQLADVKQALITGDDLLLILGESGSGKSTLLNQLGVNSGVLIQCFAVKGSPRFSTLNLFAGMLEAFKVKPPENLKEILEELIPCLQTMVTRNTLSTIVLDDADQISESELTQLLSGMLYVNSQDQTLLRVALAARPEFEDRIPDLLPEGADLPYSSLTIDGMTRDRIEAYLEFRLQNAGYFGDLPFNDDDIDDIISHSNGFPGGIHNAAAELLNQFYDQSNHVRGAQRAFQRDTGGSFLQSRKGKFALGTLALLLIAAGLGMFMPGTGDDPRFNPAESPLESDISGTATQLGINEGGLSASSPSTLSNSDMRVIEQRKIVPYEEVSKAIDSLANNDDEDSPSTESESTSGDEIIAESSTANAGSNANVQDSSTQPVRQQRITRIDSSGDIVIIKPDDADETPADSSASLPSDTQTRTEREQAVTERDPNAVTTTQITTREPSNSPPENSRPDTVSENSVVEPSTDNLSQSPDRDTLEVDPELLNILESPTWILMQDRKQITVQMSASRDRSSIESFLKRNRDILTPPNSIYTFRRNGEVWYALLHGLFNDFNAAQQAVQQMPPSALTDQPWIRNVGRVQDVLRAQ